MKIIFLDIDGVLNVNTQTRDEFGATFHEELVENLRTVINETGAKIVISSRWRYSGLETMKKMWEMRNLPGEVLDITKVLRVDRGYEIQDWLMNNAVNSYVIFDDDVDMLPEQINNFVVCSGNEDHEDCIDIGYGLTKRCAQKAINILNNIKS